MPFIENITSPVLCSNLVLSKVPELAREENLKNSTVIDVNGHKIGIVGYLTPDTKTLAVKNDVEYVEEISAIKEEVKKLQNKEIKIIIALGHSGFKKDLEIAKEVDGVDLVIGGHTNTFLWNGTSPDAERAQDPYPTYVTQASGRQVPVVQAYAYTKYLGKLLLTFDSEGEIIKADGSPILLDATVPQDPDVLSIIEKYRTDILRTSEEVIGNTSVILDGRSCSVEECNLGNLITDAMVYNYARNYKGEHWTDAPIAVIQAGGIRTSIAHSSMPTGITTGDLLGVMPFEGNLTTMTMNGSVVLLMLEHSIANYGSIDPRGEFLQYSGLKVVYNLKKKIGKRVVKAEARCWACDVPKYFKVEDKDIYKIIAPGFLGAGGDGFWMLKNLTQKRPLGYSELDCTQYYVKHHSPINPEVEGRITILRDFNSEIQSSSQTIVMTFSLLVLSVAVMFLYLPDYLTAETKFLAPKNNVEYEDEIPAIKREAKKLKHQGVNILIALGHSGFLKDLEIAKHVEDIDLVIGGHSNTFLINKNTTDEHPEEPQGPYPTEVKQNSGRIVRVVQAYAYTKYLGMMHLVFDSSGEIIKCDGYPILLNHDIPRDPELLQIVNKYRNAVDRINNVVVGLSSVTLHAEECRLKECNIGDLITDSILKYTTDIRGESHYIAVVQGGRIRASIDHEEKPFQMTRGDWITVLPFTDTLYIVTMNGSILRQALEHAVEDWRIIDSPGQFLQFSGMRVTYDLAKPPRMRVASAKAICVDCQNKEPVAIKDEHTYKVIMCEFLTEGGDGYTIFENLPKEMLTYNELDSVVYYLNQTGLFSETEVGRLTILNEDMLKEQQAKLINSLTPSKGETARGNPAGYFFVTLALYLLYVPA